MYLTDDEARHKWCPFVRVDGDNRFNNTLSGGFEEADNPYHCLGSQCMMWRAVHPQHIKSGAAEMLAGRGYCGMGERPDFETIE